MYLIQELTNECNVNVQLKHVPEEDRNRIGWLNIYLMTSSNDEDPAKLIASSDDYQSNQQFHNRESNACSLGDKVKMALKSTKEERPQSEESA